MRYSTCNIGYYRHYNGSWSLPNTRRSGGCAGTSYCVAIEFTTDDFGDNNRSKELYFTFPFARSTGKSGKEPAKKGTFYFKIYAFGLFNKTPTLADVLPTSSNKDHSQTWSSTDKEIHTASVTIETSELEPNTTYYLAIGSSETIQIGHDSSDARAEWGFDVGYYTPIQQGSVSIVDNLNNSYTITTQTPVSRGDNLIESNELTYWRCWQHDEDNGANITVTLNNNFKDIRTIYFSPPNTSTNVRMVTASLITRGTYNDPAMVREYIYVNCYKAPGVPGTPLLKKISFNRENKLTPVRDWQYSWTKANATNEISAVKGYRIEIYKNNSKVTKIALKDNIVVKDSNSTLSYIDVGLSNLTVTIDPVSLGFTEASKVKIKVYAFTKDGKNNIIKGAAATSVETLVEAERNYNVRVKVDNVWKDSDTYVKVNGKWEPVLAIYTKVNGVWQSSK